MSKVLVVLGGGIKGKKLSISSRERVEKATELFFKLKKPPKAVIFSGGFVSGRVVSEARLMGRYASSLGIPRDLIFLEELSKSTVGNAFFTKHLFLIPNNWRKIYLITSDFHMERASFIFSFVLGKRFKIVEVPAKSRLNSKKMKKKEEEKLKELKQIFSKAKGNKDKFVFSLIRDELKL